VGPLSFCGPADKTDKSIISDLPEKLEAQRMPWAQPASRAMASTAKTVDGNEPRRAIRPGAPWARKHGQVLGPAQPSSSRSYPPPQPWPSRKGAIGERFQRPAPAKLPQRPEESLDEVIEAARRSGP